MNEIGMQLPPSEEDGRPVMVISPSTEGWYTWFTGAGDAASPLVRGGGDKLILEFTGPDTKEVVIQFAEPVELHDGQLFYTPVGAWTSLDRWDFAAKMPATTTSVSGGGTGDCNRVPTGLGFDLIVPAAGNGGHTLVAAVPVPTSGDGYWDVDRNTGVVTPSATPGKAGWNLLGVEIVSYFCRNMPMGNPLGIFDIDTYKAEWVSPAWQLLLRATRVSAGAASLAGWVMTFRRHAT